MPRLTHLMPNAGLGLASGAFLFRIRGEIVKDLAPSRQNLAFDNHMTRLGTNVTKGVLRLSHATSRDLAVTSRDLALPCRKKKAGFE